MKISYITIMCNKNFLEQSFTMQCIQTIFLKNIVPGLMQNISYRRSTKTTQLKLISSKLLKIKANTCTFRMDELMAINHSFIQIL